MKGMAITAEEIAAIKELQAQGFGPYQISAQVGADPKTVRKYMKQDDFSPAVP
jgi:DNA-binding NarL/FixJ family response regulator